MLEILCLETVGTYKKILLCDASDRPSKAIVRKPLSAMLPPTHGLMMPVESKRREQESLANHGGLQGLSLPAKQNHQESRKHQPFQSFHCRGAEDCGAASNSMNIS